MSESSVWTGREDDGADGDARRWHQVIRPWQPGSGPGVAIAGFACDAGVARNQGRSGAAAGPIAIRRVLANLAWHGGSQLRLFEAGDTPCDGDQLEALRLLDGEVTRLGKVLIEVVQLPHVHLRVSALAVPAHRLPAVLP